MKEWTTAEIIGLAFILLFVIAYAVIVIALVLKEWSELSDKEREQALKREAERDDYTNHLFL
jgi:uncharacterized membrane protein YcjF (UPF0283 family)